MTQDEAQRRRWTFYEAVKDVFVFYSAVDQVLGKEVHLDVFIPLIIEIGIFLGHLLNRRIILFESGKSAQIGSSDVISLASFVPVDIFRLLSYKSGVVAVEVKKRWQRK
jgi:hypothetical protein